jgi:hypothetical protein
LKQKTPSPQNQQKSEGGDNQKAGHNERWIAVGRPTNILNFSDLPKPPKELKLPLWVNKTINRINVKPYTQKHPS